VTILITNDDGIEFPGVKSLRTHLSRIATTYVCGPKEEKSGTSSALSITDDVYVEFIDDRTFIIDGYPVDCVNIGLHGGIIHDKIDLIVSGINKGVNMGDDIFYSGTVGAARHAFVHGYPAIAISSGHLDEGGNYDEVASFLTHFISNNWDLINEPAFLNINFPADAKKQEIKWTKLGRRIYKDTYTKTRLKENAFHFNLGGSILSYREIKGSDFSAFEKGYISITPLQNDATDYARLKEFSRQTRSYS